VELIFNTRTSKGRVQKNATITSNDSSRASITIDFVAFIFPDSGDVSKVKFTPSKLEFNNALKKSVVTVLNDSGPEVRLKMANFPADTDIKVKVKDDDIKAGKKGKLEIEWAGQQPEYDISHVVTFETNSTPIARFSIPYTIKGIKGPQPITPPHAAAQNPLPPNGSPDQNPPITRPPAQLKVKTDSVHVPKPIPPTNWPPK
jgi:hypothetical protein